MRRGLLVLTLMLGFVPLALGSAQSRPGSLDPSFGSGGIVSTTIGPGSVANAVALQGNGKIVAVGWTDEGGESGFAVVRYNPDGSLDTTFGTRGIVVTHLGRTDMMPLGVAIQRNNDVVVAGATNYGASDDRFLLIRYRPDGSLDPSFGTAGIVTTAIGSGAGATGVVLQADGKIVAAGDALTGAVTDFALARYNPDGSLDSGFGSGGIVTSSFDGVDSGANAIALQSNGKIVAAGVAGIEGQGVDFALARYDRNGSLDPSFGSFGGGGEVVTPFHDRYAEADSLAIQPDGEIIAGGYAYDFALARYHANGSLDRSFGSQGRVITHLLAAAQGLAPQADGKIVAAGGSGNPGAFTLARYTLDGSLDQHFGNGGIATASIGTTGSGALAVVLQPDNNIVAAGETFNPETGDRSFALARFLGGPPDCVVPKVRGKTLKKAKRTIRNERCSLGRVRRAVSRRVPRGLVISQRPRAHTRHAAGTKVSLVVSKGRR